MTAGTATMTDQGLEDRVCSEYLEMPGLRLTDRQAQRLFNLGERDCATVLRRLVERGFLAQRSDGMYVRPSA
jgi:hypothetical protein